MPCSWRSRPSSSPSRETRSVPVALTAYIRTTDAASVASDDGAAADGLRHQLRSAAAVEQPFDDACCVSTPVGVGTPYAPVANSPSESVPQMPHDHVHRHGADRIVDAQVLEQRRSPRSPRRRRRCR